MKCHKITRILLLDELLKFSSYDQNLLDLILYDHNFSGTKLSRIFSFFNLISEVKLSLQPF